MFMNRVLPLVLTIVAACGGPVYNDDLNRAKEEIIKAAGDPATQKVCQNAETSCKAAENAALKEQAVCDAAKKACEQQPAAAMTKARCQAILPWAIGQFTKCGPMGGTMQTGSLFLDVPSPPVQGVDCVVGLTGFTVNVTPVKELRPTGWNTGGDLTSFSIKTQVGTVFCSL